MPDRILPAKATARRASVSVATLYRMIQRGEFPRQCRISTGRVGWPASTVEAWIKSRVPVASAEFDRLTKQH
jgi:prophage regulatory protein